MLAPGFTMLGAALLVDLPIKKAAMGARPGCDASATQEGFPGSGCETFGGPSTHAFASYGALGTGSVIFLVDTFKYSDGRFSVPGLIGNVGLPLTAAVFTTIGRAIETGTDINGNTIRAYEDGGQIAAGAISGLLTGALVGLTYSFLQRPSCGYGDSIICW